MFVSRTRLSSYITLPRVTTPWALDSGAFTEINRFGRWRFGPKRYAAEVWRFRREMPLLQWASIQDWMCEPLVLKKTGLTIEEHQRRTVRNFLDLRDINPYIQWLPVLQGWSISDYMKHYLLYEKAGVNLQAEPLVGVGSICRRQHTSEAEEIIRRLSYTGIKIHAFGFKKSGVKAVHECLASADSMAWSYQGRFMRGRCPEGKNNCANCLHFALEWRRSLLEAIDG